MSGVLYEVEITPSSDQPLDTGTWLDNLLRQVLENEGFESGRAYRNATANKVDGHHLALQFRVRSEAELDDWIAASESSFLGDLATCYGDGSKVITRRLLAASELATPSDAAGNQSVTECPNGGARVAGKFCASCGQDNNVSVVAFHRLIGDFLRDFLNFDSRLFSSIWPLIGKPGFLKVEYLAGRRATYLPPVRMTLFLSIIFFALVAWQADGALVAGAKTVTNPNNAASRLGPLLEMEVDDDDRIELTSDDSGWLVKSDGRSGIEQSASARQRWRVSARRSAESHRLPAGDDVYVVARICFHPEDLAPTFGALLR